MKLPHIEKSARKPLYIAGGVFVALLVVIFVLRRRNQTAQAQIAQAQSEIDDLSSDQTPASPGYFEGSDGISSYLSDYPGGIFGTSSDSGGGGSSGGGATDTNPLSPTLDSTAGVDLGPVTDGTDPDPVSGDDGTQSGGGAPDSSVDTHRVPTHKTPGLATDAQLDSASRGTTRSQRERNQRYLNNRTRPVTTNLNNGRTTESRGGFAPVGSAHPAPSHAPARQVNVHAAQEQAAAAAAAQKAAEAREAAARAAAQKQAAAKKKKK